MTAEPGLLDTITVAKPWGKDSLPAPFVAPQGERIGEIWFDPPPALDDILVKYLFTSEKLSVQVHPSDAQAPAGSRGKEECWLVLDAEPGASLAIGFREPIEADAMRAAAIDGSIEELLEWHPVQRGDFFYLPAGTVHAIGAGVTILEIQQNSDITYRLFDYGRPRELHLDESIAVARGEPYGSGHRHHFDLGTAATLVDGPFFRVQLCVGNLASAAAFEPEPLLVLPLEGQPRVADQPVQPGQCALAPNLAAVTLEKGDRAVLVQPKG